MYGTNGRLKRSPDLQRAAGVDTFGDRAFLDAAGEMNALSRDVEGVSVKSV